MIKLLALSWRKISIFLSMNLSVIVIALMSQQSEWRKNFPPTPAFSCNGRWKI